MAHYGQVCEKTTVANCSSVSYGKAGNSATLLDFLKSNRIAAALRLSPDEINDQIREEREAWE